MSAYIVHGGNRIEGKLKAHGSKNAALPILAAATICGDCVIKNCPELTDISAAMGILGCLGKKALREGDSLTVTDAGEGICDIPDELMRSMRSSIVFLGAAATRCGRAVMTRPGGCELGPRPIDMHLSALKEMGAQILEEGGRIICEAPSGFHGARIELPFPSVGATENVIITAAAAKGETLLKGAAKEPEIGDLIKFLVSCGAEIEKDISGDIRICGRPSLSGCSHSVMADRIEAGTYLCAAAVTGGRIEISGIVPAHILSLLVYLKMAGCAVYTDVSSVKLMAPAKLRGFGEIKTSPYPGFPTDLQAIMMAAAATAEGETVFEENIFENRYRHVSELNKLGADISVDGRYARVKGGELTGAELVCTDLRGGAAAVVGALAAKGESRISSISHIDRGYQSFDECLRKLGADIVRIEDL